MKVEFGTVLGRVLVAVRADQVIIEASYRSEQAEV